MTKKLILISILTIIFLLPVKTWAFESLASSLRGRILLQVEKNGEAWYVRPEDSIRIYMGRPSDAFEIMRNEGEGISETDFWNFRNEMPARLKGKIVLRVEDKGQAYYVCPETHTALSLGRPAEAFKVMRESGLGISNRDLESIPVKDLDNSLDMNYSKLLFDKVNTYRIENNFKPLIWHEGIASVAKAHSEDMALALIPFSHIGFEDRFRQVQSFEKSQAMAENLAYNKNAKDPLASAFLAWLNSSGHKANIEGDYIKSGIGIAKSMDGSYFFTQIFVK